MSWKLAVAVNMTDAADLSAVVPLELRSISRSRRFMPMGYNRIATIY